MLVVVNRLYVKKELRREFETFIASRLDFIENSSVLEHSFERPVASPMSDTDHYLLRSVWRNFAHLREWMKSPEFLKAHAKLENRTDFYFQENELLTYEIVERVGEAAERTSK